MPPQDPNQFSSNKVSPLSIFVALIVLVLIGFLFFKGGLTNKNSQVEENIEYTKLNLETKKVDQSSAKSLSERLPVGFPQFIPVEAENIVEAYSQYFAEKEVTLYVVRYTTKKSVLEKYNEYLKLMTSNSFVFGENGKDQNNGMLYGTKGNDSLTVIADNKSGQTQVLVSYLDVK